MNENAGLPDLLELNRDLQGSRAIRLLATTNLSLYATLMERHLSDGTLLETELVIRLERDLADLDDPQSGLALSSPGPPRAGCTASSMNATTPTSATSPKTPAAPWIS